jgi:hypothetical protein
MMKVRKQWHFLARREPMADKTSELPADQHEIASRLCPVSDCGIGGRRRKQNVLVVGIDLS